MAKYCASCNHLSENDDIRFCPSCGSSQFISAAQPPAQSAPNETAANYQQPPVQTAPVNYNYQAPVIPPVNNNFAKKNKKKSGAKKIILAGIALCLVVCIVLNFSSLVGLFKRNFGSAKSYYTYVEKESLSDFCNTFEKYYGNYFFDNMLSDSKHDIKMDIKLSDELLDSLAEDAYESVDLDWMKNMSLDLTFNTSKSAVSADMTIGIDKQDVLTAVLFSDAEDNKLLVKLNEISDDILKLNTEDSPIAKSGEFDRELLAKVLPKAAVAKKLIKKYHGIFVENIENVEKTKDEVSIDDVTEELTVLTCTLTEKDVNKISLEILNEIKSDKDIKSIIESAQEELGEEGLYTSFIESIDEQTEELKNEAGSDETVTIIRDYVNSKDEIVGRKIGENGETLDYLKVESDSKYAEYFNTEDGISIKGAGTKKGDRITGECVFLEDNETLYKMSFENLDNKALKKGKLDGKIRIVPNSETIKDATTKDYQKYVGLLDMAFEFDIKGDSDSGDFKLSLLNGEKALLEATATYSVSSGKNTTEPEGKVIEVNGLESLSEYIGDTHLDDLISKLRKTSVPKEYIDAIEELSNQLKEAN